MSSYVCDTRLSGYTRADAPALDWSVSAGLLVALLVPSCGGFALVAAMRLALFDDWVWFK